MSAFYFTDFNEPELDQITAHWQAVLKGDTEHLQPLLDALKSDNADVRHEAALALHDLLKSMNYDELTITVETVSYALAQETNHEVSGAMVQLLRRVRNVRRMYSL